MTLFRTLGLTIKTLATQFFQIIGGFHLFILELFLASTYLMGLGLIWQDFGGILLLNGGCTVFYRQVIYKNLRSLADD